MIDTAEIYAFYNHVDFGVDDIKSYDEFVQDVGEVSGDIAGGSINTHDIKYNDRIHYLAGDYDVKFPLTAKITVNGKIEERTITIWK